MNKNIVITGATGFLGGYTVEEFVFAGYNVTALGRNQERGNELEKAGARFIRCDISDTEALLGACKGAYAVVHVGAKSTVWGKWQDFEQTNVIGTKNVAEAAIKCGAEKMVYVSSPSIYSGNSDRFDIKEDEFDKQNNLNFYIRSKIISEQVLSETSEGKIKYNIIRPRGLVGIGDTSIIPRLIRTNQKIGVPLLNGGKNLVDMTSVENAAYALRLAVEANDESGSVYNITNGDPRVFKDILEKLFYYLGVTPKYLKLNYNLIYSVAAGLEKWYELKKEYDSEPALTRYTVCTLGHSQTLDITRAKDILGYKPKVTLDETVKKYAEHYNEHTKN